MVTRGFQRPAAAWPEGRGRPRQANLLCVKDQAMSAMYSRAADPENLSAPGTMELWMSMDLLLKKLREAAALVFQGQRIPGPLIQSIKLRGGAGRQDPGVQLLPGQRGGRHRVREMLRSAEGHRVQMLSAQPWRAKKECV